MFREYTLHPIKPETAPAAIRRITLVSEVSYDTNIGSPLERWLVNGKSFGHGESEPVLQKMTLHQRIDVTGALERINVGDVVEVLLVNNDLQPHPWHLHGYTAYILGSDFMNPGLGLFYQYKMNQSYYYEKFNYSAVELAALDTDVPNVTRGDTWIVPPYGYTVFRIKADNVGPWIFHCHMEWHLMRGMAALFSVERDSTYTGIEDPPPAFPLCGQAAEWHALQSQGDAGSVSAGWRSAAIVLVCLVIVLILALIVALRRPSQSLQLRNNLLQP